MKTNFPTEEACRDNSSDNRQVGKDQESYSSLHHDKLLYLESDLPIEEPIVQVLNQWMRMICIVIPYSLNSTAWLLPRNLFLSRAPPSLYTGRSFEFFFKGILQRILSGVGTMLK